MKGLHEALLTRAVRTFRRKKVLVLGDLMLDLYVEGPPRFVSQEAPVVVLRVERKYYKLGGAANSAENVKALGAHVLLAGVVGDHTRHDDVGRSFLETIRNSKLPREGLIFDPTRPTTLKMRVLSQGQQIVRVDEEHAKPLSRATERKLIAYLTKAIPSVDTILVSDYYKGVVTPRVMSAVKRVAKKRGKKVVVDPRPQNRDLYHGVNFITPNDVELSRMFGEYEVDERRLSGLAKRLHEEFAIDNVLLTRGSRGMDLVNSEKKVRHIPTFAKKVLDVSGAGDTVAAVVALGASDLDPYHLAYLASFAAKVSIEKHGTATVSVRELIRVIHEFSS